MPRVFLFAILLLLSCEGQEEKPTGAPVYLASLWCDKDIEEMRWLTELIKRSKNDMSLKGDIYAGKYEGQVVFIHQPMIMSCLACIVYDCDGVQLDRATFDIEKLQGMIDRMHRIYSPHDL